MTLKAWEGSHALDDLAAPAPANDNTAPELQEDFTQDQISAMSSSEVLQELKERLDIVKAGEKIVGTRADVLMRFCLKVKNNEVHGYTTADEDYKRLVEMVQASVIEYRQLAWEAAQIDETIRRQLDRLTLDINKEIDNPEWNSITLDETEKENQEKMEDLERERDSYSWILRELLSQYPEEKRNTFSPDINILIENINVEMEAELSEDKNEILRKQLTLLWHYLGVEANKNAIRWVVIDIPEDRVTPQMKQKVDTYLAQTFPMEEITDEKNQEASDASQAWEKLLQELYDLIKLTEEEQAKYDELKEKFDTELNSIKEKITSFVGKENNTASMKEAIWMYDRISDRVWQWMTNFQKLKFLEENYQENDKSFSNLDELSRITDIALRDEGLVWTDNERLWDVREKSTNEAYERILQNDAFKEAIEDGEWNVPKFEELRMDDISALKEAWANLAELFLTDVEGKSISWNVEQWKSYVVNFWGNTHLSWKMDFAFIGMDAKEITVDGKELTFDTNSFKHEWLAYNMRDGSLVEIKSSFEDDQTPAQETRHNAIQEQLRNLWITDAQNEMVGRALQSTDPNGNFEVDVDSLPGWIVWFFLAMILNIWDGRNFKYDPETNTFREVLEDQTLWDSLSNADIATWALRRWQPEQISIDAGLESQPPGVRWLVNLIYQKESRWNANAVFGGYTWPRPDLTSMTIREVRRFQDQMVRSWAWSSAVWAPQIIRGTMDGAIRAWILDPNEKFDAEAQNRFTLWKLNQRGLQQYASWRITDMEFMKRLSMEWASFPKDMWGASYYAWDGLNRALISPQQVLNQIHQI